ncbi:MAG: DNA-binding domain-containing protein [Microscillaceae bacterium]|nr:DNA-binding domain-containing protein [Microscillaceae bacterium]
MAVKYALYENQMTSDPDDCMAIVQHDKSYSVESVLDAMMSKGSTVTKAEALSVMEEFAYGIETLLKNGGTIKTELFNLSVSVQGVFINKNDSFDPKRHRIKINISAGTRLKKLEKELKAEKVAADKPMPTPVDFKDINSNTLNETLSSGGVGQLNGSRLKIENEADANQGIFLISDTGVETKVSKLIRNKPAEVLFMIPEGLTAGKYTLEVRTVLKGTKEPRKNSLPYDLTVV